MSSGSVPRLAAFLFLLVCPARSTADILKITSSPAGTTVEIDGVLEGMTPFEKDFSRGLFSQDKDVHGFATGAPYGRADKPRGVRHKRASNDGRPDELDFVQWPESRRILATQKRPFPCGPAAHIGSVYRRGRSETVRRRAR